MDPQDGTQVHLLFTVPADNAAECKGKAMWTPCLEGEPSLHASVWSASCAVAFKRDVPEDEMAFVGVMADGAGL